MNSSLNRIDFCPHLQSYFQNSRVLGRSGRVFESLGSLSTINNLVVLRRLMFELKPDRTLEVGLCFGASALTMATTHRDLGAAPTRQHIAVDPFQQECWDDAALVALEKAELDGFVELKQSYSGMVLPRLWEEKHEVQLAYIDGSHIFEDVFVDCYFTMRLLSEGGIMAFDDSSDPHVQKVVRFLRSNMASCFEEVDLNRYREEPMNPSLYQLARRLGRVQMTAFRRIGKSCRQWDASFAQF